MGRHEPVYFVDGARPEAGADSGIESEVADRCVQYSEERPDVQICGTVAPDWTPPPEPYFEPNVCQAALEWLAERHSPAVDPESCLVIEGSATWDVVFVPANGGENVHVPFDPTGTSPWLAHP